ncbi:hypothetical protein PsAD13_01953 [Pseudovibrio sp. Ad13]|nr:hypothetical protein PsAD13_01953 [Pseudovibrio sp. Ad13]
MPVFFIAHSLSKHYNTSSKILEAHISHYFKQIVS